MEQFLVVSSILLWIVVGFNLLLTLALVRRINAQSPEMAEKLKSGQTAPDFKAETLQGMAVTRANYADRPVTFVFVSPTCAPCRKELPKLEALSKSGPSGAELVLVSDSSMPDAQALVDEFHLTMPILVAARLDNDFMTNYKVAGTPFYCMVGVDGKVQSTGFLDETWKKITATWEASVEPSSGKKAVVPMAAHEGG